MVKVCPICNADIPEETGVCSNCGKILFNDKKVTFRLFREGVKTSAFCNLLLTEKFILITDMNDYNGTDPNELLNVFGMMKRASDGLDNNERMIPVDDIEKIVFPAPDVKIFAFLKRKGKYVIRIHRKSTGKYTDIMVDKVSNAEMIHKMLLGIVH